MTERGSLARLRQVTTRHGISSASRLPATLVTESAWCQYQFEQIRVDQSRQVHCVSARSLPLRGTPLSCRCGGQLAAAQLWARSEIGTGQRVF